MIRLEFNNIDDMKKISMKIENASALTKYENLREEAAPTARGGYPKMRGFWYGKEFGRMALRCWEFDTVPTTRKFFTDADVEYSNWFKFKNHSQIIQPDDKENATLSIREFIAEIPPDKPNTFVKTMFKPLTPEEMKSIPPSQPGILCFDFETYSDNHKAFPDAKNKNHTCYMCSFVYQRLRDPSSRRRVLLTTKDACVSTDQDHPAYKNTKIKIDEFVVAKDEEDFVYHFIDIIRRLDPDLITGYNIDTFDYMYIDERYKMFYGKEDWPAEASRTLHETSKIKKDNWKSNATGAVETKILKFVGRITVDLMTILKREHKLVKYTLNAVSKKFLGAESGKHDVSYKDMFKRYEEARRTMDFEVDNEERTKAIDDMSEVGAYAMQDSELVMDLFEKMNIWTGMTETSSIAGITLYDVYTRGQQYRVISALYNMASRENIVLDSRRPRVKKPYGENDENEEDDDSCLKYGGGSVEDPIPGIHDNVLCEDFNSLYPSIMIAYNICITTMDVRTSPLENSAFSGRVARVTMDMIKKYKEATSKPAPITMADFPKLRDPRYSFEEIDRKGKGIVETQDDIENLRSSKICNKIEFVDEDTDQKYSFGFVSPEIKRGLLPRLVSNLVEGRKDVRKLYAVLKNTVCEDPEEDALRLLHMQVLQSRQLAYKVMANSMYGFLGAQATGKFSFVEGAMSTTARGRQLIGRVNDYVKDTYGGTIVYGDTDSSMFSLPNQIKSSTDCQMWGERLAEELTALFPPPLRLEYEKGMRILCFKKKKYAALEINADGSFDVEMLIRGIALVRRDNCPYLQTIYQDVLEKIMYFRGIGLCFSTLMQYLADAFRYKVSYENFEIVKRLNSDYKADNFNLGVFARECARVGCPVKPGDRLEFLYVKNPSRIPDPETETLKPNNLGLKMRLTESWKAQDPEDRDELDIMYYVEHMLMNPLDQLFGVPFEKEIKEKNLDNLFCFRPRKNCKYDCTTPVKMVVKMITTMNSTLKRKKLPLLTNNQIAEYLDEMTVKFSSLL